MNAGLLGAAGGPKTPAKQACGMPLKSVVKGRVLAVGVPEGELWE